MLGRKMNKRRIMMQAYAATWIVFFGAMIAAASEIISLDQLSWTTPVVLLMMLGTLIMMYLAAEESKGGSYARRNTFLGFLLLPLFGLGFAIFPPLVNSEINRQKKSEMPTE
jgi:cytochrome bd-type quinol oxidase subunit 2